MWLSSDIFWIQSQLIVLRCVLFSFSMILEFMSFSDFFSTGPYQLCRNFCVEYKYVTTYHLLHTRYLIYNTTWTASLIMEANSDLLLIDVVIFENSFWAEICKSAYWAVFLATAKRLRIPAKEKTKTKQYILKHLFKNQRAHEKWLNATATNKRNQELKLSLQLFIINGCQLFWTGKSEDDKIYQKDFHSKLRWVPQCYKKRHILKNVTKTPLEDHTNLNKQGQKEIGTSYANKCYPEHSIRHFG